MNGIAFFDKKCSCVSGTVTLHQCSPYHSTHFVIDLIVDPSIRTRRAKRAKRAKHALHIHEYGNLSQGCMGAGGHYNPFGEKHGGYKKHKLRRHVGDLINNVESDSTGRIKTSFFDNLVTLYGPSSVFGRTIVFHSGEDDLGLGTNAESLITGNAGGRMACALIGRAQMTQKIRGGKVKSPQFSAKS